MREGSGCVAELKDVKGIGSSYSGIIWNNLIDVIFFFG